LTPRCLEPRASSPSVSMAASGFRCSHVSLCCSSLLSRCSYRFFTWAPFHSGRGWPKFLPSLHP
jgi:hypothetical protein